MVFWKLCVAVVLIAGLGAAQECDPATKVLYETPVSTEDVTPLLSVEIPASCAEFQVAELLACQEDINVKEGCCNQGCKDIFTKVESTCLQDIVNVGCDLGLQDFIPILDNLVRRCDEEYVPLACGDAPAAVPTEIPASAPAPAAAASEECDPATKIPYETPITADQVAPFIGIPPPESCAEFQVSDLLVCQSDINIKEGCCDPACRDVVNKVDATCLEDLLDLGCSMGLHQFVPVLDNLARRCDDDYIPRSCPTDGTDSTEVSEPAGPPATSVSQECSPTLVQADEPANVTALLPLASLALPASCEGFSISNLLSCQTELNIVEGCCGDTCKDVLKPVSQECTLDMGVAVCELDPENAFPLLKRVLLRCHHDPVDLTCADLLARGGATAAVTGPAAEGDETVAASLDASVENSEGESLFGDGVAPAPAPVPSSSDSLFGDGVAPAPAPTSSDSLFGDGATPTASAADEELFGPPAPPPADTTCGAVDENADAQQISSILSLVDPAVCEAFSSSDLFDCQNDISLDGEEPGCCDPKCKKYLEALSEGCIKEILAISCRENPDVQHIFQRTAKRCIDGYEERRCDEVTNAAARPSTILTAVIGAILLGATLLF